MVAYGADVRIEGRYMCLTCQSCPPETTALPAELVEGIAAAARISPLCAAKPCTNAAI